MIKINEEIEEIEFDLACNWDNNILKKIDYDNNLELRSIIIKKWKSACPKDSIKQTPVELLNCLLSEMKKRTFSCLCALLRILCNKKIYFNFAEYALLETIITNGGNHPKYKNKSNYYFAPGDMESRIKYVEQLLAEYKQ